MRSSPRSREAFDSRSRDNLENQRCAQRRGNGYRSRSAFDGRRLARVRLVSGAVGSRDEREDLARRPCHDRDTLEVPGIPGH
jgi:hypothetical protein